MSSALSRRFADICLIPHPPVSAVRRHCTHNSLAAAVYMDVLNGAVLFSFAAIFLQRLNLCGERPQQPIGAVCK
jgi:hypothetical protein